HELEIGLRLHRDEEDRYQNDDRYMMLDGRMVQTSAGAPGTQDNRVGEAEAVSLYVQDTISFGNWILTPGLRYEHIDLTRRNYSTATGDRISPLSVSESSVSELIPGLGATWLASDRLTAFASVHKGFNPPGPGSGAEPEESVNTEIGLRWANNGTRAELVAFHVDYSNLVGTCTASTGGNCNIGDQFDGGEARVKGIEATFGHRIELGNGLAMPLQLAYTWTEAEFRNGFSSDFGEWGTVEAGDQLPYLPEHTLHAEIGLRGERWRIGLGANYLDSMRTVAGPGSAPAGERTDSALVWDLSAGYALFANAELYARVENLSDREYIVGRRPPGPAAQRLPGPARGLLSRFRFAREGPKAGGNPGLHFFTSPSPGPSIPCGKGVGGRGLPGPGTRSSVVATFSGPGASMSGVSQPSSFAIDLPDSLIARARRGDASAFEQIYRKFERPVFTLALRLTADREE